MDYKAVLEEQIRELQKHQDFLSKYPGRNIEQVCDVAKTISNLLESGFRMGLKY
jgi:hypothetical protein